MVAGVCCAEGVCAYACFLLGDRRSRKLCAVVSVDALGNSNNLIGALLFAGG